MTVSAQTLERLAKAMRVHLLGPEKVLPGQPVRLSLLPKASDLRVSDLLLADITNRSVAKDVRFNTYTVLDDSLDNTVLGPNLAGGIPLLATAPVNETKGEFVQTAGKLPVPAEVPVTLEVTWEVYRVNAAGTESLYTGYAAPEGVQSPDVELTFPESLVTGVTDPYVKLRVKARVTLRVGTVNYTADALPPVPLFVMTQAFLTNALTTYAQSLEVVRGESGLVLPGQPAVLKLQQIPGAAPLPDDVPLRLETEWVLKRKQGTSESALAEGTDFEAPLGMRSFNAAFSFLPQSAGEATTDPITVVAKLKGRLSAGPLSTGLVDLALAKDPTFEVMSYESLKLQILREGAGKVVPGRPLPLRLLSPVVPLEALLGGKPPVALGEELLPSSPVRPLELRWFVEERVDDEQNPWRPWAEGTDFLAPQGLLSAETALVFRLLTGDPPVREIRAGLKMRPTGADDSQWVTVALLPLQLLSLNGLLQEMEIRRIGNGPVMPGQTVALQVVPSLQTLAPVGSTGPAGDLAEPFIQLTDLAWVVEEQYLHEWMENGVIRSENRWKKLEPGIDFVAPQGVASPTAILVFPWRHQTYSDNVHIPLRVSLAGKLPTAGDPITISLPALNLTLETIDSIPIEVPVVRVGLGPVEPCKPVLLNILPPFLPKLASLGGLPTINPELPDVASKLPKTPGTPELPIQIANVEVEVRDAGNVQLGDFVQDRPAPDKLTVLLAPPTVPLTNDPQPPTLVSRTIVVKVTVQIGPVSREIRVPITVQLLPLPIPVVLALFRHNNFSPVWGSDPGCVFLMVPENSPLVSVQGALEALKLLRTLLEPLKPIARLVRLITGLGLLADALATQPVKFAVRNTINLKDVNFQEFKLYFWVWEFTLPIKTLEDEMSSFILIGREGTGATLFDWRSGDSPEEGPRLARTLGPNLIHMQTSVGELNDKFSYVRLYP